MDEPASRPHRTTDSNRRSRFGDVLRRLRRRAGWTQDELAVRLGLQGHAFISQVENGRLPLPAHWLVPLARELDVNPQRLAWIYVAMEQPDLYEAIGGRKPPDLDPDTLLRMLSLPGRRQPASPGASDDPAPDVETTASR